MGIGYRQSYQYCELVQSRRDVYSAAKIAQFVGAALAAVRYRRKPIQGHNHCELLIIGYYIRVLQQSNILYYPRFGIFFLFEKENACKRKAKQGESPCTPGNAAPQYIARGSQLVARHIRTQTRRSLNECVLVRLASQAVPSLVSIGLSNTAARLLKA